MKNKKGERKEYHGMFELIKHTFLQLFTTNNLWHTLANSSCATFFIKIFPHLQVLSSITASLSLELAWSYLCDKEILEKCRNHCNIDWGAHIAWEFVLMQLPSDTHQNIWQETIKWSCKLTNSFVHIFTKLALLEARRFDF